MSPIAWILAGILVICPRNDAQETKTRCTCQQSGLGPFGSSSTSSHQSGHETFEHLGSSSETSDPNGSFGFGHDVTHGISSAAEAADSLLSPFGDDKGELGSFGHPGSSSHHHVSITYGQSGHSKSFRPFGTSLFGPPESSSGTSESSGSVGLGHYGTYATSSIGQAAEAEETNPSPNWSNEGGSGPLRLGPFKNSGAISHHHVSITYGQSGQGESLGPLESSSGTSESSGSLGLGQYGTYATSSMGQAAEAEEANPSPNWSDEDGSGQLGLGSFGHSGSSSHHHVSITYGHPGQSKSFEQLGTRLFGPLESSSGTSESSGSVGLGHYGTYATSSIGQAAEAEETNPSPNWSDEGGSGPLGLGPFENSGSISHHHVSITYGQSGQGESLGPLESSSGTSESSGSLGLGNYATYATSSTAHAAEGADTNPSTNGPDEGGSGPLGYGPFGNSGSSSHHHVSITYGQSGLSKSFGQLGTGLFEPLESSSGTSESSGSLGFGHYGTYATSSTGQAVESEETNPSPNAPDKGALGPLGLEPFVNSGSVSHHHVSITYGQSGQSESLRPLESSSGTSESSGSLGLGHFGAYATSSTAQAAGAANPSPNGSDEGGSGPLGYGLFGNSGSSSHHHVSITYGQSGQTKSFGQLGTGLLGPLDSSSGTSESSGSLGLGHYGQYATSSTGQAEEAVETNPYTNGPVEGGPGQLGPGPFGNSGSVSHHHVSITYGQSGQSESLRPLESSSGTSESSGSLGLGHYGSFATSSTAQVAGVAETNPSPNGSDEGGSGPLGYGQFGNSGSKSHHRVSVTYGQSGQSESLVPLESSSGTSESSGSLGLGHYGTYATSSTVQAAEGAETNPSLNGPDEGGPGPLGPGPFGNSESSSYQHVSISFGQSGQNESLGQGLGHYISYNNSEVAAQTKPSEFESDGAGSFSSGSVPFGQSKPSADHHITVSIGLSGDNSNEPGYGLVGLSGSSSVQNETRLFEPSEEVSGTSTPSGSFGSGHYVTYTTSSTALTAEAAGTRPSPNGPDGEEPAPLETGSFGHSGSSSYQHTSLTFGEIGQNKSSESGLGQYIQYNNSVEATTAEAAEKKTSTMEGEPVPSESDPFSHAEPSSDQDLTVSVGISDATSDKPEREPVGSSESTSVQHGTRLFEPSEAISDTSTSSDSFVSGSNLKYSTSSTAQTAEESQTKPSPNGSDGGGSGQLGSGLLGNSESSSNQQVSITFGKMVQSQPLGQELGQYISDNKSVTAAVAEGEETKPSLFGQDVSESLSSGSASFGQSEQSSDNRVTASSIGLSGTSSDQLGNETVWPSGSSSDQQGAKLFEPSEVSSGTSTQSESKGSGNYVTYITSSTAQASDAAETRPSPDETDGFRPGPLGSGLFGDSESHQNVSVTYVQSGQNTSSVSSDSDLFGQSEPSLYQQVTVSTGQFGSSSDQPGLDQVGQSEYNTVQNGTGLFEVSEAGSGSSTSSGSFGSGHYLKFSTSSGGQTTEEPETPPSPIGPDTGGPIQFAPGLFGQSESSSNQHVSINFGQLGQNKSFGEGLEQYNQYSNAVASETKPSQFGSDGGGEVSSGSFGQQEPSSYQQVPGSVGQYATISDQPERGPDGLSGSSSGPNGIRLFGTSEANSGTSTSSGSFGSEHSLKYSTSSVGQTAAEPETGPSSIGTDTGGPGLFGESLGQYNQYSNSVVAETKPSQFGPDGGVAVSSGSISFGQPVTSSYQQIFGSVGQYATSSDQPGHGSAASLGLSSDQLGDGLFGPSGANSGTSTQSALLDSGHFLTHTTSSIAQTAEATEARPAEFGPDGGGSVSSVSVSFGQPGPNSYQRIPGSFEPSDDSSNQPQSGSVGTSGSSSNQYEAGIFGTSVGSSDQPEHNPVGLSGPNSVQVVAGLFEPSDASSGTSISNGLFGSDHYVTYATSPAADTAEAPETGLSLIGPDGGGTFEHSGDNSQKHVSVIFGQSEQIKLPEQGLGHYNPYSNSVAAATAEAAETIPSQSEPDGEGDVPSGSVSFWQQGTSPDRHIPGSFEALRPSSVQSGAILFGPSEASLGTSTPSGSFGSGNYLKYSTSTAAQTAEAGLSPNKPGIGTPGPFGHSVFSSHQHVSVTFGQSGKIKSSEHILGHIPFSNSAAVAMAVETEIKPSPYGSYGGALTPSELGPSGPSENISDQPGHGPFETTGTSSDHRGSVLYRPLGPNTGHFEPSELMGPGPYMQYTPTSAALTAEETETEPLRLVKNGEEPVPTGFIPFWPSGHSSYKPVTIPFSLYGSSADHPEAGSFGLSSIISYQPATGPYETWEQSTGSPGTGGSLGEVSNVPNTISSEAAMGTVGRPSPGFLGPSGSSTVISVPSGLFALGPGLYVPYRNAGAAMTVTEQKEPTSFELSTGQSTAASESSEQLGSGLNNSHTHLQTTTVVAVSPADKKTILKSASRLSSLLTTARVSTAISYLLPSGGFSPSSLSKVISYLIKSIPESQPGLTGNEILIQALLEVIVSLMHILSSASIVQVDNCPSSSSSLVGQSLTHALGG